MSYGSALSYFSPFQFHVLQKCISLFFLAICGLFDFACSGFIIGIMTENQDRLRHDRVTQHAYVRSDRSKPLRPQVDVTPFHVEASSS